MRVESSEALCPSCNEPLKKRGRGEARNSARANTIYAVAGVVGCAWIAAIALWSPVFLVPKNLAGAAVCLVVYLAPGFAIAWFASSLPRVYTVTCRCGWSETREITSTRSRG